jgi:hypothetical protein
MAGNMWNNVRHRNVIVGSVVLTWFCIVLFTVAAAVLADVSLDKRGGRVVEATAWILVASLISSVVIVYLVIGFVAGNSTIMTDDGVYAVTSRGPVFIRWDQIRRVVAQSQIYATHIRVITDDTHLDIVPGPLGGWDAVRAELSRHLPSSMLATLR